jgi:hypothetical protein
MKRAFVKSALVALAIMLISVSAFAADVSASTVFEGNLWADQGGFFLNNQNQKDADLIQLSVSDAQFGASFRLWAPLTGGTDGGIVNLRKVNMWVKPVSMLKISLGNVSAGLFTEQLNWWMVPCGESKAQFGGWSPRWSSGAAFDVEGGLSLELTPVDGFSLVAGIAPGYNNAFMAWDGTENDVGGHTAFGLVAKYAIKGIGTIGASYRYNGGTTDAANVVTPAWQNIRAGMDFTMVPGLYAFLQGVLMIDNFGTPAAAGLAGVTIDNYIAYSAGAFSIKAEFPYTLRLTGDVGDDSYMTFDLKASYKVGAVSPYLRIRQNGDKDGRGYLDFGTLAAGTNLFAPAIDLGADYSIGKAGMWTAVRIVMAPTTTSDIRWSIPFNMRISW